MSLSSLTISPFFSPSFGEFLVKRRRERFIDRHVLRFISKKIKDLISTFVFLLINYRSIYYRRAGFFFFSSSFFFFLAVRFLTHLFESYRGRNVCNINKIVVNLVEWSYSSRLLF